MVEACPLKPTDAGDDRPGAPSPLGSCAAARARDYTEDPKRRDQPASGHTLHRLVGVEQLDEMRT